MASLFKACDEIQGSGNYTYTIGNNEITIETFDNSEIQDLLSNNLRIGSASQENIVLIKDTEIVINVGQILAPTDPKKSLVIFCDVLTNNGTISMTGKGPNVLPHEYVILQSDSVFDDVIIPAYANNRVERKSITSFPFAWDGTPGKNGINRQCGSGGQGASTSGNDSTLNKRMGATGSGYAFGGGAGSGGKSGQTNTVFEIDVDVDPVYPMKGANGFAYGWFSASGGVGNPSGRYSSSGSYVQYEGLNGAAQPQNVGVGGRIIIFCNNFVNNGTIQANGVSAYSSPMYFSASGGASGGGAIDIFYGNSCQQGIILASGGIGGDLQGSSTATYGEGKSGNGGNGSITVSQLNSEIMYYTDKIREFNYTGKTQAVTLEPGVYEFYCRGAQGGGNGGTYGGSTLARINLLNTKTFYINVGQQALSNLNGGWNGGKQGSGYTDNGPDEQNSFGGGGSTDISVSGVDQDSNWNTSLHLNSRIIMTLGGTGVEGSRAYSSPVSSTGSFSKSYQRLYSFTAVTSLYMPISLNSATTAYTLSVKEDGVTVYSSGRENYISTGFSVKKGRVYEIIADPYNFYGNYILSLGVPALNEVPGGEGGGKNYIYTELTKNTYPVSPCNAGTYYMIDPIITPNDPLSIGDGYAYIKTLRQTLKVPTIIGEYYYNTQAQSPVLNNFSEEKMTISNNIKTNVGTYIVTIKPLSGYYWEDGTDTTKSLTWIINKIDPEVTWPESTPIELNDSINKSNLINGIGAGLFTWTNPLQKTNILLPGYEATFTPNDLTNYNIIKNIISIEIIFPDRLNSNIYWF